MQRATPKKSHPVPKGTAKATGKQSPTPKQNSAQTLPNAMTNHARARQQQRGIPEQAISNAITSGSIEAGNRSTVHRDEKTQVVLSKSGQVITVLDNKRNTNFDLLQKTKERESYLLRQVQQGNDSAMCELAELYLDEELGSPKLHEAKELLLRAAREKNNSHAMCLLANIYSEGILGGTDQEQAYHWLGEAAKFGNKYALARCGQRALNDYLEFCEQASPDPTRKSKLAEITISYLSKAARKGSTRAIWQLAHIYEKGLLGQIDLTKAIELYIQAARDGSPSSLHSLQKLVEDGSVKPNDFDTILNEASEKIARTSSGLAVEIGYEQIKGALGSKPSRGLWMLEQAAQKRNPEAMQLLVKCLRNGLGCDPDLPRANQRLNQLKKLLDESARRGNVGSLQELGLLHLNGSLGEINTEAAVSHLTEAARQHHFPSVYTLGKFLAQGRLGNRSPVLAQTWIHQAIGLLNLRVSEGDIDAIRQLVKIYRTKKYGVKNISLLRKWLNVLVQHNDINAMIELTFLCLKDASDQAHFNQAVELVQKLVELNLSESLKLRMVHVLRSRVDKQVLLQLEEKAIQKSFGLTQQHNPVAMLRLSLSFHQGRITNFLTQEMVNSWVARISQEFLNLQHVEPTDALSLFQQFDSGELFPKNFKAAAFYLIQASFEIPKAATILNKMLLGEGLHPQEKSQLIEALDACTKLLPHEPPYRLGRIMGDVYSLGQLISPNLKTAIEWYEQSATLGNTKAMLRLSELLKTEDPQAAEKWLEKARTIRAQREVTLETLPKAEQQFRRAKAQLSQTSDPQSTQNFLQAAFWFRKASKKGHQQATFDLAKLYEEGQLGDQVRSVSIPLYKKLAKQNDETSIAALIRIYSRGEIIAASPEKAQKWHARQDSLGEQPKGLISCSK